MNEPWDQTGLEGLDDDVDIDEDSEELAGPLDHHDHDQPAPSTAEPARLRLPPEGGAKQPHAEHRRAAQPAQRQRRYRIQAMSPRMQKSFKNAESVLITLRGGAQILFVRKG